VDNCLLIFLKKIEFIHGWREWRRVCDSERERERRGQSTINHNKRPELY